MAFELVITSNDLLTVMVVSVVSYCLYHSCKFIMKEYSEMKNNMKSIATSLMNLETTFNSLNSELNVQINKFNSESAMTNYIKTDKSKNDNNFLNFFNLSNLTAYIPIIYTMLTEICKFYSQSVKPICSPIKCCPVKDFPINKPIPITRMNIDLNPIKNNNMQDNNKIDENITVPKKKTKTVSLVNKIDNTIPNKTNKILDNVGDNNNNSNTNNKNINKDDDNMIYIDSDSELDKFDLKKNYFKSCFK